MREPIIQIAGVIDGAEAELLVAAGVTHLGFPLRLPDGREDLSEAEARDVIARVGDRACCVLITYQGDVREVGALARDLGVGGVQLHGDIAASELQRLRRAEPDLFLIASLVVGAVPASELRRRARELAPWIDAFITDTFDPATGRRGATGLTHDWAVSRERAAELAVPLILAGGLTPENVAAGIREVRPAGVDAHTGVEGADGRKDRDRIGAFVARARRAFAEQAR